MHTYEWICSRCGSCYAPQAVRYTCPRCPDQARLEMRPDYARIAADWDRVALAADPRRSLWRYGPLLPLLPATIAPDAPLSTCRGVLSSVGGTPLYRAGRLADQLGLPNIWIKDDGRNPTGSLKDRASAVVLARALELGETTVATASSGNAAAALAGLGAATGLHCVIFVPASAPATKIAQLLISGATVLLVEGSYDDAVALCRAACDEWGWYNRSTALNPYTAEGKKTCALEICEQLGWQAPSTVIVSVGDGNIITGLHRGFSDALGLGWIDQLPRLIGVQAAAAPALFQAWRDGADEIEETPADTLADSINVGLPSDGFRALRAMRNTGGQCLAVEDEAILEAMARVAQTTGLFTEPACAAAFAGLFALVEAGALSRDETVVVVNTGTGLKDPAAATRAAAAPMRIAPNLEAIRNALDLI
ncbi:MAG: threonine synthase [Oscillochloridaceae bacterium umkhey_bin13]